MRRATCRRDRAGIVIYSFGRFGAEPSGHVDRTPANDGAGRRPHVASGRFRSGAPRAFPGNRGRRGPPADRQDPKRPAHCIAATLRLPEMLLEISHRTTYRYDAAPTSSTQVLRLTPRSDASQSVLDWRIDAGADPEPWRDGFGNQCHTLALESPPSRIDIVARGRVATACTNGVLPPDGCLPELFLPQTFRTRPDPEIAEFASGFRGKRLDVLHDLMAAIRDRVVYETGVHQRGVDRGRGLRRGSRRLSGSRSYLHRLRPAPRRARALRVGISLRWGRGPCGRPCVGGRMGRRSRLGRLRRFEPHMRDRAPCLARRRAGLRFRVSVCAACGREGRGEALEVAVRVSAEPLKPGRSRAAGRPR